MRRIAIFASGSGSNFQAIIDAIKSGMLQAEVRLLVCDQKNAKVIERANKEGIPSFIFSAKDYPSKPEYEKAILQELRQNEIEWIILAGFMRIIGETLIRAYEGKMVNIHPSLLPAFPGKDAIGQALNAKVNITGVTIHYVDQGMDTGPIIAQQSVTIEEHDTHDSLQKKIQQVEHILYPKIINELLVGGKPNGN